MIRVILSAILIFILSFSCSDPVDKREQVRSELGEPYEVYGGGSGPYRFEVWYFDSLDIGYEFRQTAPKCGGSKKGWYVANTFRKHDPDWYPYYKEIPTADSLAWEENGNILEP